MALKRKKRDYGSGSIYQNADGSFTAAVRINGQLIRRRAASREAAEARIAELLAERSTSNQHIARLDGMVVALELWWQRLPEAEKPRYRLLLDARIRPVIDSMRDLGLESGDVEAHAQLMIDWLNEWFNTVKSERGLKARTIEHYTAMVDQYLIPALGQLRLYELTAKEVQRFVINLRAEIAAEGKYTGIRTTRAAFSVLRDAMTVAFQRGYIGRHPCDGVILPPATAKPIEPLSDDQLRAFLKAAADARYPALWYAYALMGLRRGEGLALAWPGVNWKERTIRIEQQVQRIEGRPQFETPKSSAGRRLLPLPALVYDALRAQYDKTPAAKRMGLIFPSSAGTLIWPTNLDKT